MKKSKPLPEKNYGIREVRDLGIDERNSGDILKELEIPERTQKPPSAELFTSLNGITSKPPFSYLYKVRENDTR